MHSSVIIHFHSLSERCLLVSRWKVDSVIHLSQPKPIFDLVCWNCLLRWQKWNWLCENLPWCFTSSTGEIGKDRKKIIIKIKKQKSARKAVIDCMNLAHTKFLHYAVNTCNISQSRVCLCLQHCSFARSVLTLNHSVSDVMPLPSPNPHHLLHDEVLVWLSVWSEVQIVCICLMPLPSLLQCFDTVGWAAGRASGL